GCLEESKHNNADAIIILQIVLVVAIAAQPHATWLLQL
ncbi:hypothetical protein CCACVL1_07241, partial [Corchorus capsularis]